MLLVSQNDVELVLGAFVSLKELIYVRQSLDSIHHVPLFVLQRCLRHLANGVNIFLALCKKELLMHVLHCDWSLSRLLPIENGLVILGLIGSLLLHLLSLQSLSAIHFCVVLLFLKLILSLFYLI